MLSPNEQLAEIPLLEPHEWRALIYLHRVDELGNTAPSTDRRVLRRQLTNETDPQIRAAIACLIGMLHANSGEFAEAEYWFQAATGAAIRSTWVSARVASVHANQLLWNSDAALATAVFDEIRPIDHPLSNLGVRTVHVRIAHAADDRPETLRLMRRVTPLDCHDPIGLIPMITAVIGSSMALTDNRLAEAEYAIREALLTSTTGTRAHGILVNRLGHVLARCGLLRETDACRRTSQAELGRWPGEARGTARRLDDLLTALGFQAGASGDHRSIRWPADSGRLGRTIVELQSTADAQLQARDPEAAAITIRELILAFSEHTRRFESIEARALAVQTLADMPRLAIGLGRLREPADCLRVAQAVMAVILTDQTRESPTSGLAQRFRHLVHQATLLDPARVNLLELTDLEQRIARLERYSHRVTQQLEPVDYLDRPLPDAPLVLIEEADGRVWRSTSSAGETALTDLGPADEITRAERTLRLAAAAMGLGHAEGHRRLTSAAQALDQLLFDGCSWENQRLTMVPGQALPGLPWRLLPTIRRSLLSLAVDADESPAIVTLPYRICAINGPGLGVHSRPTLDAIVAAYPEGAIVDEPALTPSRLLDWSVGTDVVHIAGHGPLERSHFRLRRPSRQEPVDRPDTGSTGVAHTVVFGSCDLTLNTVLGRSGLAWRLICSGATHVVASMIDLGDEETDVIMPMLHRMLAGGTDPATAIHRLQFDDPHLQAAADSLICIGWPVRPLNWR